MRYETATGCRKCKVFCVLINLWNTHLNYYDRKGEKGEGDLTEWWRGEEGGRSGNVPVCRLH